MANQYDATVLEANAHRLDALAKTARSNMLSRTTEKGTRLGADGERLGRQARAAEAQRAEADQVASAHLAEAAGFDAKASALEQQAAAAAARGDYAGKLEATELGEEAAKAREGAAVARGKSQIAADDAKRLADEAAKLRAQEQAIDAELADMGARLPVTELAVDQLEWHAEKARAMADTVKQADDLNRQAAVATARGDHAAAAELGRRAASLRDDADALAFVRERPPFPVDYAALQVIGVAVSHDDLAVPLPELIDPNALINPLTDASPANGDDEAVATAAEPNVDNSIVTEAPSTVTPVDESSLADTSADSAGDPFDAPLVDAPSFDTPSFAASSFEAPSFDEPVIGGTLLDGSDGGFADAGLA